MSLDVWVRTRVFVQCYHFVQLTMLAINRVSGLRYCMLLYRITLFIMLLLGEPNISVVVRGIKSLRTTAINNNPNPITTGTHHTNKLMVYSLLFGHLGGLNVASLIY